MTKYHYFLITLFAVAWGIAAIHPATPQNWFQENIVIFFWVPVIILFGRYIKLSNTSYTIITAYLLFHLIGAHYNYGSVPFGQSVGELVGSGRNEYDRLVHLSFGLLMVYPFRELFLRITNVKGFWGYFLPINIILSFSAVYEIFEWISGINLPPDVAYLFIGGTDPWDAEKDMAMAGIGATATILLLCIFHSEKGRKLSLKLKETFRKNAFSNS